MTKEDFIESEKNMIPVISIMRTEKERIKIDKVEDYYQIFLQLFKSEETFLRNKKHFWVIGINKEGYTSCIYIAALGIKKIALTTAIEPFKAALEFKSTKVIIAHNQIEEGILQADAIDLEYTNKVYHKAKSLDIELIDHMIIGHESLSSKKPEYYSYKEKHLIEFIKQDITYKTVDEASEELEREKQDREEEGREKGEKDKAIDVARKLLKSNVDISIIVSCTGLSKQRIEEVDKAQKLFESIDENY